MFRMELLVSAIARLLAGVFFSTVIVVLSWAFVKVFLQPSASDTTIYFLKHALLVGSAASVGIIPAWWNTATPLKTNVIMALTVLVIAMLSSWVLNELRGVETYYALAGGVHRVEVFSVRYMLEGMMTGAVIGGNLGGLCFYSYRGLIYREF
tara:strand:+ start:173 stop:628 length:456 start_codon:yes stop_codon:yes gene_type:complete